MQPGRRWFPTDARIHPICLSHVSLPWQIRQVLLFLSMGCLRSFSRPLHFGKSTTGSTCSVSHLSLLFLLINIDHSFSLYLHVSWLITIRPVGTRQSGFLRSLRYRPSSFTLPRKAISRETHKHFLFVSLHFICCERFYFYYLSFSPSSFLSVLDLLSSSIGDEGSNGWDSSQLWMRMHHWRNK